MATDRIIASAMYSALRRVIFLNFEHDFYGPLFAVQFKAIFENHLQKTNFVTLTSSFGWKKILIFLIQSAELHFFIEHFLISPILYEESKSILASV